MLTFIFHQARAFPMCYLNIKQLCLSDHPISIMGISKDNHSLMTLKQTLSLLLFYTNCLYRADSRFAPSQWETVLLCNHVSHWLGASLESALSVSLSACTFLMDAWKCSFLVPGARLLQSPNLLSARFKGVWDTRWPRACTKHLENGVLEPYGIHCKHNYERYFCIFYWWDGVMVSAVAIGLLSGLTQLVQGDC